MKSFLQDLSNTVWTLGVLSLCHDEFVEAAGKQLQQRIMDLDGIDGTADGKFTPRGTVCRACGAKVGAGLPACQFCGQDVDAANAPGVFDGV